VSCPQHCFAWVFCILLPAAPAPSAPQVRHELGTVRTGDDQPVSHAEVDIDGINLGAATDKGAFSLDVPPFMIGFPYTFHVTGWVIVDPCVLARGRLYLPDPDAEKVALRVVRPGDSRLLSANSIGCLVEEKASRFEPKRNQGVGSHSELPRARPSIFAQQIPPGAFAMADSARQVRLLQAAYHVNPSAYFAPAQDQSHDRREATGDKSLGRQAKDLGFTTEQLQSAIERWRETATDPYQRGLASFNAGRYAEASDYILQSIKSGKGPLEEYVPLGRAEYELGHYPAAESALRQVLAVHGDDPLILNDLGLVLNAEAKYAEAEPLFKRALAIDEKALGPEHPQVASDLNNLAALYVHQGKYAEAEPLLKQALMIDEKVLGPEHPQVAKGLNNLSALYADQGKYAEAEPLFERALAIDEKALGPEHPQVASDLNNLAALYVHQGKYAEAEPLFERALAIDEKALGPQHPQVATRLNNLAMLYYHQGKYAEAKPLFERALAIDEKALGPGHPDVARDLNNLGALYVSQGKYAEAEPLAKRALSIDEKALGPEHPTVATMAGNLALLLQKLGRDSEAKVYEEQAARIRAKTNQKPKADNPNQN